MATDVRKSCAFTGHRPRKFPWRYDEADPQCVALKAVLAEQIGLLADAGITQYLSGMAEAVDTWASLSVLDLREKNPAIKLHCILPCTAQADKWSASSRELYRSILERADSIVYVSRDYHKGCMLERDRFLVEYASVLLAVYNGVRCSGTGATVNYAKKMGREIIVIDPISLLISLSLSFLINLGFAVLKLVYAVRDSSFWDGGLAIYNILLCAVRVYLIRCLHQERQERNFLQELHYYPMFGGRRTIQRRTWSNQQLDFEKNKFGVKAAEPITAPSRKICGERFFNISQTQFKQSENIPGL